MPINYDYVSFQLWSKSEMKNWNKSGGLAIYFQPYDYHSHQVYTRERVFPGQDIYRSLCSLLTCSRLDSWRVRAHKWSNNHFSLNSSSQSRFSLCYHVYTCVDTYTCFLLIGCWRRGGPLPSMWNKPRMQGYERKGCWICTTYWQKWNRMLSQYDLSCKLFLIDRRLISISCGGKDI